NMPTPVAFALSSADGSIMSPLSRARRGIALTEADEARATLLLALLLLMLALPGRPIGAASSELATSAATSNGLARNNRVRIRIIRYNSYNRNCVYNSSLGARNIALR